MAKVIARVKSVRVLTKRNGVNLPDNQKGIIAILSSPVKVGERSIDAVSFNKALLMSMGESEGISINAALMSLKGSNIECDAEWHDAGEVVKDNKGTIIMQGGVPRVFSSSGFRFNNITIDFNLSKANGAAQLLESMEKSRAYAESLALPPLPAALTLGEGRVEEIDDTQDTQETETTTHSLSDIAASMTTETPAQ